MAALDFLRFFMAPPLSAATGGSEFMAPPATAAPGGSEEEILRSLMHTTGAGAPATFNTGGFGAGGFGDQSAAQQLFPGLLRQLAQQQLAQMQMQQPSQGIGTNESGYMQLAQMPGNVLGGLNDRYQAPPPPLPGRTNFPLGRWGYKNPERYPVLPKVPDTRDQGLKAGGFRQLPWWLKV